MRCTTPCLFLVAFFASQYACFAASQPAVEIEPREAKLVGNFARLQFRVALNQAGRTIDVTREAHYESASPKLLAVSSTGQVRPLASGQGTVRVQYGQETFTVPVVVEGISGAPAVSFRDDVISVFN